MNTSRRHAVAALVAAGLLWGTTVPLSKLALEWLPTGWLTATRFGLAAAVLLAVVARTRPGLRAALRPGILASGALGYGGSVIVQNAGITRTSVTHAALLIGAVPVLVAVIAAVWHHSVARPVAWVGFAVSLAGVGLVTAGGGSGGGAAPAGDGLVLASLVLSATFTVGQARLLRGRDPVAVTAVQFLGAAIGAMVFTAVTEGVPAAPAGPGPVLAVAALVAVGTLAPFTLFAYGQSRVSAEIAGAFLNLEPLVGAVAGAVAFGDPVGAAQIAGGAAILAGIGLSSLPLITRGRSGPRATAAVSHRCAPDRTVVTAVRSGGDARGAGRGAWGAGRGAGRTARGAGRATPGANRRSGRHAPGTVRNKRNSGGAGRYSGRDLSRSRGRGPGRGGRRARRWRWRPGRPARR
jgi:O-acetylserine/cysteine efflux transporter